MALPGENTGHTNLGIAESLGLATVRTCVRIEHDNMKLRGEILVFSPAMV